MAAYGPNTGKVPFTGYTNTLGNGAANVAATSGHAQFNGMTQADGKLSRHFRTRGNRVLRELFLTLLAGSTGSAASEVYSRVEAKRVLTDGQGGGGLISVESVTQLGRNAAAADVTNTVAAMSRTTKPSTYPTDAAGNGGGGKAGF
jgi:hypothetical protein